MSYFDDTDLDALAQVQDWDRATDPQVQDRDLTPAQLAYRQTLHGSTWRLRRSVDNLGSAIHDALPKPLRRFFAWYGRMIGHV